MFNFEDLSKLYILDTGIFEEHQRNNNFIYNKKGALYQLKYNITINRIVQHYYPKCKAK